MKPHDEKVAIYNAYVLYKEHIPQKNLDMVVVSEEIGNEFDPACGCKGSFLISIFKLQL